jgi:hypothetical protein
MEDSPRFSIKFAFILQIVWFFMFFTNVLGFIGSRSEFVQDIVWLGAAAIGISISLYFLLIKKQLTRMVISTLCLSVMVLGLWVLISGISQM